MTFNSFPFIFVFLPVVLLLYYSRLDRLRPQAFLLWVSAAFYGIIQPSGLPLIAVSILLNWWIAERIGRLMDESARSRRKRWLVAGLTANIALLCWFKYLDFFLRTLSLSIPWHLQPRIFPLGISFFTLQQIMYLVDCYEGLAPANGLLTHAAFVSFFPYITSGPISRSKQVVPRMQSGEIRQVNYDALARGLMLFLLGLSKKAILADSLAIFAAKAPDSGIHLLDAWRMSAAYALQLYFDFSGYSDMARGVARMLNIDIPRNFNSPFRALSVTEFWQRWHMTLTQFLTTYLYTPMLRSARRISPARAVVATLITMFIVGLWHGPNWTFAVFGLLHGIALSVNLLWKRTKRKLPDWLAWTATACFLVIAFVFFRSPSIGSAWQTLAVMFGAKITLQAPVQNAPSLVDWAMALTAVALAGFGKNSDEIADTFTFSRFNLVLAAGLALLCVLFLNSTMARGFIYRDF